MLITDSTYENGIRRGPKYLKKLVACIDEVTGDFDYNAYLRTSGFLITPENYAPKVRPIERNAIYLLSRLDGIVRSYRPVWDWVVLSRWGMGGVDHQKSVSRSLSLSRTDLKRGNINDAAKRMITHLLSVVFKKSPSTKNLKWPSSDQQLAPLIIGIEISENGEDFTLSNNEIEQLFSIGTEILVAANDRSAVKHLLDRKAVVPTPQIVEGIIIDAIDQGMMEDAEHYLELLSGVDPYNPKTAHFSKAIERSKRITSLSRSTGHSFQEIQGMDGTDFEDLIIQVFRDAGYVAQGTPRTGDYGADVIIETQTGTRIVVQCKRYKARLNLKAVQEVISAMSHYSADYGIVVTTNGFLKSAIELAKSADVELWGQDEVVRFLAGDLGFSSLSEL